MLARFTTGSGRKATYAKISPIEDDDDDSPPIARLPLEAIRSTDHAPSTGGSTKRGSSRRRRDCPPDRRRHVDKCHIHSEGQSISDRMCRVLAAKKLDHDVEQSAHPASNKIDSVTAGLAARLARTGADVQPVKRPHVAVDDNKHERAARRRQANRAARAAKLARTPS